MICFLPTNQCAAPRAGETLLEFALRIGIKINNSCGGSGTCTTCRVIIKEGLELLPPRVGEEAERAEERAFEDNERLSCQIPAINGLRVLDLNDSNSSNSRLKI